MDNEKYMEAELLESFALGQLPKDQSQQIDRLLLTDLKLGEALEAAYIRIENRQEQKQ